MSGAREGDHIRFVCGEEETREEAEGEHVWWESGAWKGLGWSGVFRRERLWAGVRVGVLIRCVCVRRKKRKED